MGGDELGPVLLEGVLVGAVRAQRLAGEDEIGDATDEILDGGALGMKASGSRGPQGGRHAVSVIGRNQERVKRRKKFSKMLLS